MHNILHLFWSEVLVVEDRQEYDARDQLSEPTYEVQKNQHPEADSEGSFVQGKHIFGTTLGC